MDIRQIIWAFMLADYSHGKLRKSSVIAELRAGNPPPKDALDMIADIIEGTGKPLKNGQEPRFSELSQRGVVRYVYQLEGWITDPESAPVEYLDDEALHWIKRAHARTKTKNRKRESARYQAKNMVAGGAISMRTLESWLKEFDK